MQILYSNEEKKPWSFDQPGVSVEKIGLRTGDYTIRGLENRVTIERKSLTDAVGTILHDWLRFCKQLRRMAAMDAAVIVIESTPDRLYAHDYVGEGDPESVMGRCSAIMIDYAVPVVWWGSREAAQRAALQFLALAQAKIR